MSKKRFQAISWLQTPPEAALTSARSSSFFKQEPDEEFAPSRFLTPGWTGEGLISKPAVQVKRSLQLLFEDSLEQFSTLKTANRSMRLEIFNLFLSFAHDRGIACHELDKPLSFWNEFDNDKSPHAEVLKEFKKIFCFRSVTTYLFKLKFILSLSHETRIPVNESNYISPNNFLSKIFRKGSSRELHAECLNHNIYSWYKPVTAACRESIRKMNESLSSLSITEMMKICTYRSNLMSHKDGGNETLSTFSHSLSHKDFGLFLNTLLINFPEWHRNQQRRQGSDMNIVSTKFVGDQLVSLSQSHWLAQEHNLDHRWKEILCPDFQGDDFSDGLYHRVCHELQSLSFLVKVAGIKGFHPIDFICSTFARKSRKNVDSAIGQMTMFEDHGPKQQRLYDRIVVTLLDQPKKNPHHFLVTHALQEETSLSSDGYLYVFSNQKLFVPSQVARVKQLLENLKLVSLVQMDKLKGRGEIPSWLYVFKKRKNSRSFSEFAPLTREAARKEPCFSFNFSGELRQFHFFKGIRSELENFFERKDVNTLLFQAETDSGVSLEFHQDAIMDGQLVHSNHSKDPSRITHPNFFKSLTRTCLPLEHLFQIDEINSSDFYSTGSAPGMLFQDAKIESTYQAILIVNQSNPEKTLLELIPSDTYKARYEKYGTAYFNYFGLIPKRREINYNLIREFFESTIGNQIIQMMFNGGMTKVKGKIMGLLVPRFFFDTIQLPSHLEDTLEDFFVDTETMLTLPPEKIMEYCKLDSHFGSLLTSYPWHILGSLSSFKRTVEQSLYKLTHDPQGSKNPSKYHNPHILEKVVKLEKISLYPRHEDVYIEINVSSKEDIFLPLDNVEFANEGDGQTLKLKSGKKVISTFHGDATLLHFLHFIIQNARGCEVGKILQNLKAPRASELKSTLDNHESLSNSLQELLTTLNRVINSTITKKVSL